MQWLKSGQLWTGCGASMSHTSQASQQPCPGREVGHGAADFTVTWVNRSECWHGGCPYQQGICPSLSLPRLHPTVTSAEGSGARPHGT